MPTLLIPLRASAAFLLISEDIITVHSQLLSGHGRQLTLGLPSDRPAYPGNSRKVPCWTAWARPSRLAGRDSVSQDTLYLAREDGHIYYLAFPMQNPSSGVAASHAGHAPCHIDTAFAVYGNLREPDVLAILGDMSAGGFHKVTCTLICRVLANV